MLRAGVDITGVGSWLGGNRGIETEGEGVVSRLGSLLALCNYRNADIRELLLYVDVPCGAYSRLGELGADIRHIRHRADEFECSPDQVVCELPSHLAEFEMLQSMARLLRRQGAKIALAHSRPDDPLSLWIERLRPDYVRMSDEWFSRITSHHASRQLLASLVHAIKDSGAQVLFEGLDSAHLLARAVEAGADFLQGNALQPGGLVGTLIDPGDRPLPLPTERSNVVPLSSVLSTHQAR
ncbi:MAG: EAL domain-containing protein [Rhizobiaceae bacterium]